MKYLDFEDDGASFRVRRERELDQMFKPVMLNADGKPFEKRAPPSLIKWVLRAVGVAAVIFLAILAFCIIDGILWAFGFDV